MAAAPNRRPLLVMLAIVAALIAFWVVPFTTRVLQAERADITVTECANTGPRATPSCRGTWTFDDGTTGSGGVGGAVSEGERFRGWATATSATGSIVAWALPPLLIAIPIIAGGGSALVLILWLTARNRLRRKA